MFSAFDKVYEDNDGGKEGDSIDDTMLSAPVYCDVSVVDSKTLWGELEGCIWELVTKLCIDEEEDCGTE